MRDKSVLLKTLVLLYCARYFQSHVLKKTFIIYLILQILSNHPETFKICSRDHLETFIGCYSILNISDLKKIIKKPGPTFSKSNNFGY